MLLPPEEVVLINVFVEQIELHFLAWECRENHLQSDQHTQPCITYGAPSLVLCFASSVQSSDHKTEANPQTVSKPSTDEQEQAGRLINQPISGFEMFWAICRVRENFFFFNQSCDYAIHTAMVARLFLSESVFQQHLGHCL